MKPPALGEAPATSLTDTRIELHWLSQVVGAAADAFLPRKPDDSQSNMVWNTELSVLMGRDLGKNTHLAVSISDAQLLFVKDGKPGPSEAVRGKTIKELLTWATKAVSEATGNQPRQPLALRDYEMPKHPVSGGQPFAFENQAALSELSKWFQAVTLWLGKAKDLDQSASDVRCWPHHFDIGGIFMLEPDKPFEEARQMGFGWSPGDSGYDQPYFYITPFPVPESLPDLKVGHWRREGFTGAILTGTDITAFDGSEEQNRNVELFLRSTIEATLPLV